MQSFKKKKKAFLRSGPSYLAQYISKESLLLGRGVIIDYMFDLTGLFQGKNSKLLKTPE